ncbi:phospholipid/cholesterol/gamma-HCH transport system substrate-binding protein [Streptomyces africanus]|uniref:Phospholipid/cholesterol/gamma-HCH transport system substrate-binding protein n=1 Tax=Streptomyces africanus TaxID=231024 RepID=A0ABU0QN99_9ACTN|nr:MCE family protein [Streptomyces africanus]MDQ0748049.1 phospholipid/cholesterol/gamma-HCH transport system substrate-binding protein [Streptomyces africanus]
MRVLRLRLYGVVFIAVLALLLSLSVAVYRQVFTPVVRITLEADSLGNQLDQRADVKLRGLLVGEVREVRADGTKATLDIALKPEHVAHIPSDVHARLLPKTLFGEKYVDLVPPAGSSARPIRAGDVITQDRTRVGIEVQQLMNDLLPLLRTVQPGKLNATLSAFATALEGRGDRIGDNLTRVEAYLRRLNPHLPSLKEDIARFADVAEVYGDAAPDLMEILRNTVTTSRTITEQKDRLAAALKTTATVAGTAEDFLDANGDRLITLGRVSRPTLELFARYSPQYPCLLAGLVRQEKASEEAFRGGKMHITLEVVRPQGAYEPGEVPRYGERSGPDCRDLPHPPVPAPGAHLNDGSKSTSSSPGGPSGVSATRAEQRAVGSLVSPVLGVPADEVPPVATLLFGPMARGTAVSVA